MAREIVSRTNDFLVWYAKDRTALKVRKLYKKKRLGDEGSQEYFNVEFDVDRRRRITEEEISNSAPAQAGERIFAYDSIVSGGTEKLENQVLRFDYDTTSFSLKCGPNRNWKAGYVGTKDSDRYNFANWRDGPGP